MNITDVIGLTAAQKAALKALGAVDIKSALIVTVKNVRSEQSALGSASVAIAEALRAPPP